MIEVEDLTTTTKRGPTGDANRKFRLVGLIVALGALSGSVAANLGGRSSLDVRIQLPLSILVIGFALSERFVIHAPIRRSTHTLTLSEVVFVLGLLFGSPRDVVIAQIVGGAFGLALDAVVPWTRKLFNIANYAFACSIGVSAFLFLQRGRTLTAPVWGAALAAACVMSVTSLVGISLAMTVTGDRPNLKRLGAMFGSGLGASSLGASIGVLIAITLWHSPIGVMLFAPLLAAVFFSTRAFIEQRRHRERLEILHGLTATMLETRSINESLPRILETLASLFACEAAEIMATSDRRRKASTVHATMRSTERRNDLYRLSGAGIIEWVDASGRPGMSLFLGVDDDTNETAQLVLQGRLLPSGPFTEEEKSFAQTIAHHLSMMMRHTKLVAALDDTRQEVAIDPLTGIGNRRRLQEAFNNAATVGLGTSIVTLDLDGFKEINDRYGHEKGDSALISVARSMESLVEERDVPTRLGGDEFAVLVVGLDHERRAIDLAERIRVDLTYSIGDATDGAWPQSFGASFGVATSLPGEDLRDLLHRSDIAMYRAKRSGKGRVEVGELGAMDREIEPRRTRRDFEEVSKRIDLTHRAN